MIKPVRLVMVHNLEHFFAQESCGWCTPCREGLPWTEKILKAIDDGEGKMEDLGFARNALKKIRSGKYFLCTCTRSG